MAAAFDDVTGFVVGRLREPAFTGELTVRFVAPVPVDRALVLRARLESREHRKLLTTAETTAAGTVVARCRAIYITAAPSVFAGAPDPSGGKVGAAHGPADRALAEAVRRDPDPSRSGPGVASCVRPPCSTRRKC